jgi:hypothetical protein
MNTTKLRFFCSICLVILGAAGTASAEPNLRVGLLGGVARTLEDEPRQGGLGHIRVRHEGCESVFLCAVNASLVGGYGLPHAGGFQQWFTFDLGLRLDPIAIYSTVGFSGMIADMDREQLNVSWFSPRAGVGVRFDAGDIMVVAEAHVDYLWRWFGRDVPVAALEIGFLLPTERRQTAEAVQVTGGYASPPPPSVQVAQ